MSFFLKRCLASILALVLITFVFVSCSNGGDDDDTTTQQTTTTTNSTSNSSSSSSSTDNSSNTSTDSTTGTSSIAEKPRSGYDIAIYLKSVCTDDSLKFLPSKTAPSATTATYELNSEIGAVMWLEGNTIYYYAEGYTDSNKGIPLNSSSAQMFDFNYAYRDSQSHCPFEEIDMTGFDTSNSTNMHRMFATCNALKSLSISNFDTSKVSIMGGMFKGCKALESLDLSSFDTSKVTSMNEMFQDCSSLASLDLSSFDSSNVTDMDDMFIDCSALTSLDVSSFDTSNVTDMEGMFEFCSALKTIYATSGTDWSSSSADSSSMFCGCTSLVGGNGTVYDSSHTDATYARVDGLNGNPGYFTAKQ